MHTNQHTLVQYAKANKVFSILIKENLVHLVRRLRVRNNKWIERKKVEWTECVNLDLSSSAWCAAYVTLLGI